MKRTNPLDLFLHLRNILVNRWQVIKRHLPVIMTRDSLIEFERESIRQGMAMVGQSQANIERINVIMEAEEILLRKQSNRKGGAA